MSLTRPLAVASLSAATLAYQVLLVRVFAIAHFHHFAYMAISVAMLGFGAAGTWLALTRHRPANSQARWFALAALLTAAALVASPVIALRLPLDPTRLAWDAGQWPLLLAVYLTLAAPFTFGALANLLALTLEPERTGLMYGAGFIGAGVGVIATLAVLGFATPEQALALPALIAAAGALVAQWGRPLRAAGGWIAAGELAVAAAMVVWPAWRLTITPYKGLPQVEAYPDARRVAERTGPVGWVVAVAAPAFRHAPGLSLAYRGPFPEQVGLFLDGDIAGAAADWRRVPETRELLDWVPSAIPYALGVRERVLVIGAGGGTEVWTAAAHGARRITVVELSPDLVRLAADLGGEPEDVAVDWVTADARGFVARTAIGFDLITIGAGGGFGASAAGVHGLNEDFLHTVQGYETYLRRLAPDGVLAITRWLDIPPREIVRVILTAGQALHRMGVPVRPALVVVRSWGTATVLVKPAGFTAAEVTSLAQWAALRRFDLDWHAGLTEPEPGFNTLAEPTLFQAAAAVASPDSARAFAAGYPFDVQPASDARPYPHHYLRARLLGSFFGAERGALLPFAEWGYVALVATLAQSLVVALLLLVLPVALRREVPAAGSAWRIVGYFGAIGFAYLLAEIAAIQQLGLLLGHPVYAVAAVLAALLIGSGFGSIWSDRLPVRRAGIVAAVLCLMLIVYAAGLLPIVQGAQTGPAWLRVTVALPLLAPLAIIMGMPFPLGVRSLTGERTGLAWAWAANGFASVVAAPLAALAALELGSPALLAGSAICYAAAGLLSGDVGVRSEE
jgi:spermidine synthase